jgi:hypothetical protein
MRQWCSYGQKLSADQEKNECLHTIYMIETELFECGFT